MLRYLAILLLATSPVWADDPTPVEPLKPIPAVVPKIVFPLLPTPDRVPVSPAPPADSDAVPTLAYGQIYVVQSESDFILLASPQKLVTITRTAGPINVRGVFADGNGKSEMRTYQGPYVLFVDALENVSGRLELIAIPVGVKEESAVTRQLVDIGAGPRPPPEPGPVVPTPEPNPPTPAPTGFRVIFIYNSIANLSREQYHTLHSTAITAYLNSHCIKGGPEDKQEWRKWPLNPTILPTESKTIVDLWNTVDKSKIADKLPQLVIAVNGQAQTYPLPATEAETLALLKSKGGE